MAWRPARAISTFRDQLDRAAPKRSRASDGTIGDAAHKSRSSDHNAWVPPPEGGIVTAFDFTHDPADGVDCDRLTDELVASGDDRLKYLIFDRQIVDFRAGHSPRKWKPYTGPNPHTKHAHMSLLASAACDDPRPWLIPTFAGLSTGGAPGSVPSTSTPTAVPTVALGSRVMRLTTPLMIGTDVSQLQRVLKAWFPRAGVDVDGRFGVITQAAVKQLQQGAKIAVDGRAGPGVLRALRMV